MNRNSVHRLAFTLLFLGLAVVPLQASAQSKDQREKIDRMAAQVEELKT